MRTLNSALKNLSFLLLTLLLFNTARAQDLQDGEKTFSNTCAACHKLGEVLIGPDLTGVKSRWKDPAKLVAFVHNSQTVINGGDAYAKSVFEKFNHTIMPPQDLTDDQVQNVLAYVDAGGKMNAGASSGAGQVSNFTPVPSSNALNKWLFYAIILLVVVVAIMAIRLMNALNKNKEHETSVDESNKKGITWRKANAILWPLCGIAMFIFIAQQWEYGHKFFRPEAASEDGQTIDQLFIITMWLTGFVFIATHVLLFWYGFRYRNKKGHKAYFYPHNNVLEFFWTAVPALVLAALILYSSKAWNQITTKPTTNKIEIELFAKQFEWTVRYPGKDGVLGRTNFMLIDPGKNPLGIDFTDPASKDDYVTNEFHLPVNVSALVHLRSQDVTHDAYLVHFRIQMYVNPGLNNWMQFKPIFTTNDFRKRINNPKFDFELACNQLCGAGHFNMRRVLVIDSKEDFKKWDDEKRAKPAYDKYKATASN